MNEKKFYWIKLKTDFFNRNEIDFILTQKNGCEYIVLYLMLCSNTANSNGELVTKVGEVLIPYDINKIVRDTKHFDYDTVAVALELFKKLGLIYEENDKTLVISGFDEMVGCESKSAKRVREYRARKALQCNTDVTVDVTQENRDKIIENRDKKIDIKHTYKCHLEKKEKDYFCLGCQKKYVCENKTSDGFIKMCGKTFEEFINEDKKEYEQIELEDYDWLNER